MIIGWPSNKKGPATRPASTIVYTGWHRAEVRMMAAAARTRSPNSTRSTSGEGLSQT